MAGDLWVAGSSNPAFSSSPHGRFSATLRVVLASLAFFLCRVLVAQQLVHLLTDARAERSTHARQYGRADGGASERRTGERELRIVERAAQLEGHADDPVDDVDRRFAIESTIDHGGVAAGRKRA